MKEPQPEPGEPEAAKAIRQKLVEYAGTYGIWWMHEAAYRMKQLEKEVIRLQCRNLSDRVMYERAVKSLHDSCANGLVSFNVCKTKQEALHLLGENNVFDEQITLGESEVI